MDDNAEKGAAELFTESCGLEYVAEFVPWKFSRNCGEKNPTINWRITLKKGAHVLTCDYSQGVGHLPGYNHGKSRLAVYDDAVRAACNSGKWGIGEGGFPSMFTKPIPPPKLTDVLYSLVMDSDAMEYDTFEDWAGNCGYDQDSRSAEKIYNLCRKIGSKLRRMIDLPAAREAFQDY